MIAAGGFLIRHQAVEIEIGIELAFLGEEIIQLVDLVNLHDQAWRVLQQNVKLDLIPGLKEPGVGGGELNVHPILQLLKGGGREQGGPALRVAMPARIMASA